MKIHLNLILLLLLLYYCSCTINSSISSNSIACEDLSISECQSNPSCRLQKLNSCCKDEITVCVNSKLIEHTSKTTLYCLKNKISNEIYTLHSNNLTHYQSRSDMQSFDFYRANRESCKTLACEKRNLHCQYTATECEYDSPCCQPTPYCTEIRNINKLTNVYPASGVCELPCPTGYVCRYLIENKTCLPKNCDYLDCPLNTECLELQGVGIVSCFPKFFSESEEDEDPNATCAHRVCPENFVCQKGLHSNADCIPVTVGLLGQNFNCSICPKGWRCDSFGWGGLCIEWAAEIEEDCYQEKCLKNQFCNSKTQSCEYQRCTKTTCGPGLTCIQYQPSHPRVCATDNILPFTNLPADLVVF
ncbi:hypothetical protein DLAC_06336 [Tieghemostelium lacteum]|uniref:DSCP-N domain-containing protein n=1 Tax=Tieghemostelium lacteum TaxID=361077 RepID=A0A151ZEM9_TIELA|nr:hypothetical protein DLAC_06336 [Tieghemostelium lacteum]|eukprot:KYQ92370.1 hypothetical protein DLAC_06336 [Tieghemostelium lacteum]